MRIPSKMFLVKFWDFENFRLLAPYGHIRPKIDFSKKIFFWCRVGIFWRSFSSSSRQNTQKTYIYVSRKKLSLKTWSKGRFLLVFPCTNDPFLRSHFYMVFSFSDTVFFSLLGFLDPILWFSSVFRPLFWSKKMFSKTVGGP